MSKYELYNYCIDGKLQDIINFNNFYDEINTLIYLACQHKHLHIFEYLLTYTNDIKELEYSIIYKCIENNNLDMLKIFLFHCTDSIDMSPFILIACWLNSLTILKYILENYSIDDNNINDGFIKACQLGHFDIVKYLSYFYNISDDIIYKGLYTNKLDIFKYLINTFNINIDINSDYIKSYNIIYVLENYEFDYDFIKKILHKKFIDRDVIKYILDNFNCDIIDIEAYVNNNNFTKLTIYILDKYPEIDINYKSNFITGDLNNDKTMIKYYIDNNKTDTINIIEVLIESAYKYNDNIKLIKFIMENYIDINVNIKMIDYNYDSYSNPYKDEIKKYFDSIIN